MKKKKMTAKARKEAITGLLFITPTIIGLLILNYYPIFETVYQSLCRTGDFGIGNTFIGLENFVRLFQDKEVFRTLWNSVKYAALSLPLTIAISLVLAVLLNRKMHMRGLYRTIFFLPMVCAPWCALQQRSPWSGSGCSTKITVFSTISSTRRSIG